MAIAYTVRPIMYKRKVNRLYFFQFIRKIIEMNPFFRNQNVNHWTFISIIIEKTCLDHISGPGRGATTEPTTSRTGCCPGTGPFSPVSIVRVTAERVTEEGSWLSADLVSDRDLTLIRGLRLYELSDIMC